jgi:hypothetical protein
MGIDGIGGKPPIGPAGVGGQAVPRGEGFSLEQGGATPRIQPASEVSGTEALDRFHSGELSIDEYLDTRVDKAVEHLASVLPASHLELLKEQLKEQLKTDPSVGVLVQRATGVIPSDVGLDDNE